MNYTNIAQSSDEMFRAHKYVEEIVGAMLGIPLDMRQEDPLIETNVSRSYC